METLHLSLHFNVVLPKPCLLQLLFSGESQEQMQHLGPRPEAALSWSTSPEVPCALGRLWEQIPLPSSGNKEWRVREVSEGMGKML